MLLLASALLASLFYVASAEDPLPTLERTHVVNCYQCYRGLQDTWERSPSPVVQKLDKGRDYCSRRIQDIGLGDEPAQSDFTSCVRVVEAALNGTAPSPRGQDLVGCRACLVAMGDYIRAHLNESFETPEFRDEKPPLFLPASERTQPFKIFYSNTYNALFMAACAAVTSVLLILMLASTGAIRLHCTKASRARAAEEKHQQTAKALREKQEKRERKAAGKAKREEQKPADAVAEQTEATDKK